MVKLLMGSAGSGKTKVMIEQANKEAEQVRGTLVYVEETDKHMHLLHRNIRFVSTDELSLENYDSVYGFLCGLTSANYDIQKIYIDGLYKIIGSDEDKLCAFLERLDKISSKYDTEIIISATIDNPEVAKQVEKYIVTFE